MISPPLDGPLVAPSDDRSPVEQDGAVLYLQVDVQLPAPLKVVVSGGQLVEPQLLGVLPEGDAQRDFGGLLGHEKGNGLVPLLGEGGLG